MEDEFSVNKTLKEEVLGPKTQPRVAVPALSLIVQNYKTKL